MNAFLFCLLADVFRTGHHQHTYVAGNFATLQNVGCGTQVTDSPIGAATYKHHVNLPLTHGLAAVETHVFQGSFLAGIIRFGNRLANSDRHTRVGAISNRYTHCRTIEADFTIKYGIFIGCQLQPLLCGCLECIALRGFFPSAQIINGGLIRCNHAGAGTGFNG